MQHSEHGTYIKVCIIAPIRCFGDPRKCFHPRILQFSAVIMLWFPLWFSLWHFCMNYT